MNLKEKIKKLPSSPGVYLMKDSLDNVIYVGKSKNLKNRVTSYFTGSKTHSPKVVKLVNNLKDFDYILTDTEFEAFLLENKLIKEIKPFYNRLLKNTGAYTYIRICTCENKPSIEITDEYDKNDGCVYFGPYSGRNTVERGLRGMQEHFKVLCTSSARKASACLNYSLGLCIGVCQEGAPRKQYLAILNSVVKMLDGTDDSIIKAMEHSMNIASEKLDFESAAKYRDCLRAVRHLISKVKVIAHTKKNRNIIILEYLNEERVKYFLIRGSSLLFSGSLSLNSAGPEELKTILRADIISYFADNSLSSKEGVAREDIDEAQIIYSYLNSKSYNCKFAVIRKGWLADPSCTKLDAVLSKLLDKSKGAIK